YHDDAYAIGHLLAAVISSGGESADEVFEIVCRSARGEHEIGGMGRHVTRALLSASRPEGWELMEKMLLAAQRQEGLRRRFAGKHRACANLLKPLCAVAIRLRVPS